MKRGDKDQDTEKLALGKRARDTLSGFQGVLVGEYHFLHGCTRWTLAGSDTTGRPCDHTVDEPQLVLVSDKVEHTPTRDTGGPHDVPVRPGPH